jgi:hypothetical protein
MLIQKKRKAEKEGNEVRLTWIKKKRRKKLYLKPTFLKVYIAFLIHLLN